MPPRRGRGRRGGSQRGRNQQMKNDEFDEQENQSFSFEESQISETSSDATNQVQNGTEQPGNPVTVESSQPKLDTVNIKEEPSSDAPGKPSNNGVGKEETGAKGNDSDLPYKVKVSRLPAEYSLGDFHRYLRNTFRLNIDTIMSPGTNSPWLLVPFKTREEQESLVRLLHNHVWKKKSLRAIAFYGSLTQKTPLEGGDEPESKKLRLEDVPMLTFEEEVLSESLPLYNVPYEEQNRLSVLDVQLLSNKLHAFMCVRNPALAGWAEAMCEKNDGTIFKIEPLKACSMLEGYRSKCKFRIGKNTEGEITVGFCLNDNEFKILGVQPGDRLIHLPDSMKNAAKKFQDFIRASGKEPYDKKKKSGYWDHIIVRVTPQNSLMLIIVMFHNNLTDEQLNGIKKEVKEYFVNGNGKDLDLYSLYFQLLSDKVPLLPSDKLELLHGEGYFYENICGIKFYVGPYSILSINASSMENIYNGIIECATATPNDVVLDLCSGSGGIAFTMANKCKKVYAIETLEDHIKDAQKTKEINKIENVEFIKGKVEEELGPLLEKLGNVSIIPIIDPPRQGLVQKAINLIRSYQNIKKLVYVCSNSKMGAKNFLDLCTPPADKKENTTGNANATQTLDTGLPFLPTKAIPVDVAPHTINNTIIILFERIDPSGFPAPKKPPPVPLKRQQKKEEKKKKKFQNPRKFSRGNTFRGRPGRKWKGNTATRGGSSSGNRGGGQAGNFFRRGGSQGGFSSTRFPPPLLRQMDPALTLVAKYERRIAELEQQDRAFKAGLTMGLQALGSRGGPGGGGGGSGVGVGGGSANFDNFDSLTSNVGNNFDNFAGQFQRDRQGWQRGGRNFGNMGFNFGGGGGGGGVGNGSGSGSNFSSGFGSGFDFNNIGGGFGNFDRGRSGNSGGGGGNFNSNFNPNFNSSFGSNFNSNFNSNFGSNLSSNFGSNSTFSSNFGGGGGGGSGSGGFRNYQGNKHRR